MKVLVIGLGALGTVYSCLLSVAGHEVTGLSRPTFPCFGLMPKLI